LNAASYVADAYSVSSGWNACSALCNANDAGSMDGRRACVVSGPKAEGGREAWETGSEERKGGR
jgi:hypothetical protein